MTFPPLEQRYAADCGQDKAGGAERAGAIGYTVTLHMVLKSGSGTTGRTISPPLLCTALKR